MLQKYTFFSVLILLFATHNLLAQNGLQTQTLYNSLAAQQYQPANLALRANAYPLTSHYLNVKKWLNSQPDTTILAMLKDSLAAVMEVVSIQQAETDKSMTLVGITGNAFIANNHFGFAGLLKDGNDISPATIDAAVAKMSKIAPKLRRLMSPPECDHAAHLLRYFAQKPIAMGRRRSAGCRCSRQPAERSVPSVHPPHRHEMRLQQPPHYLCPTRQRRAWTPSTPHPRSSPTPTHVSRTAQTPQ